jgi:PAS domain S-box-containing protein
MSIGNKSLTAFLFLLALTVSLVTLHSYQNNRLYQQDVASVNHSNEILYSTERLMSSAKDVQLFAHNYVLTQKSTYLSGLDSSVVKSRQRIKILRELVNDNSSEKMLLDSIGFYLEKRIQFSNTVVKISKSDVRKALDIISAGAGMEMMNTFIRHARALREVERQLHVRRQERTALQLETFNNIFYIVLAAIICMTGLTIFITIYNSKLEKKIQLQLAEVSKLNFDLERRERRFKGLIENGFDVISILDKDIRPIYRSPAAERITGWSNEDRQQVIGVEKAHPEDRERFRQTIKEVLANPGKSYEITIRTQHKDGHYIWLEGIMKNMLHDDAIRGIVSNFRDVTQRKQIEMQQALYESIIFYSEDAIISKSKDGQIITWNRGAENLFGFKAEEAVGKSFEIFTPYDLVAEEVGIIQKVQSGIPVENYETERLTKSGKRIDISLTASPLYDINGVMIGTSQIARDITERKITEEKIHRLNIDLEHKVLLRTNELAQVNKELEALAYYISKGVHDPVEKIRTASKRLQSRLASTTDANNNSLVIEISKSASETLQLIDELIEFSAISQRKLKKEYVDICDLLREVQDELSDVGPEIQIHSEKLHPALADYDLLKKLFSKLINIVRVCRSRSEVTKVKVRSELDGDSVLIFVRDDGSTLLESVSRSLPTFDDKADTTTFERNLVPSLMVKHIINKHKGNLSSSRVNETGSEISFSIPIRNGIALH